MVFVSCAELKEEVKKVLERQNGFSQMPDAMRLKHEQTVWQVYEREYANRGISVVLQRFDAPNVKNGYFLFGTDEIRCRILEQIPLKQVKCGYLYVCHAPQAGSDEQQDSLLIKYYREALQIAILDSVRKWLRKYLMRVEGACAPAAVTDSFGPGYYGMPAEAVKALAAHIDTEKAGVHLQENGNLVPLKSLIGIYLVLQEEMLKDTADCASCMGTAQSCRLCRGDKRHDG